MNLVRYMKWSPLLFLVFTACSAKVSSGDLPIAVGGGDSQSQSTVGAICDITNMNGTALVCVEFTADSAANHAYCNPAGSALPYTSAGASSTAYVPGGFFTCASANPSLTVEGSCRLADRTIRYYAALAVAEAQADCTSLNGTWASR